MASTGGSIISVNVVFVALLQALLVKKLPSFSIAFAVISSIGGIYLLTNAQIMDYDSGSSWILLAAFLNAVYIVFVSKVSKHIDTFQLGTLQLGVTATLALIATLVTGPLLLPSSANQWIAVLGLGLVCTAYCFVMQPVAQGYSTPERAGILWSTEALFSAIFVFIFLGERFTPLNYVGAFLVMAAVVVTLADWENIARTIRSRRYNQKMRSQRHT